MVSPDESCDCIFVLTAVIVELSPVTTIEAAGEALFTVIEAFPHPESSKVPARPMAPSIRRRIELTPFPCYKSKQPFPRRGEGRPRRAGLQLVRPRRTLSKRGAAALIVTNRRTV